MLLLLSALSCSCLLLLQPELHSLQLCPEKRWRCSGGRLAELLLEALLHLLQLRLSLRHRRKRGEVRCQLASCLGCLD